MPLEKLADFSVYKLSVLDENGKADDKMMPRLPAPRLIDLYTWMVLLRTFDDKALKLQRQGRIGTYASSLGQEACTVGSAMALQPQDWCFPAFREHGMFFVRGTPLVKVLQYWGGDERGSKAANDVNVFPVSIPVGSHPLHAAGAAWAMKFKKKDAVAVAYFGDGATSEGDFHEALNFAGVNQVPCIFICQNNQFAISVPRKMQSASQTLAQKAIAYGFEGVQVDGNDVLAVYSAMSAAVDKARAGKGPSLLELYTYRIGDHTTADDSTRYRTKEEIETWRRRDPIARFRAFLVRIGQLTDTLDQQIVADATAQVEKAVQEYESMPAPKPEDMFDYLYRDMPAELAAQKRDFLAFLASQKANANGNNASGNVSKESSVPGPGFP